MSDTGCDHEWGIDGMHSNEFCKKCFISKPDSEPKPAEGPPSILKRLVMPIMLGAGKKWNRTIPFSMLNEEQADRNHGQTLKRLAERGGLGPDEAIAIMDKRKWMAMPDEAALTILQRRLDANGEA